MKIYNKTCSYFIYETSCEKCHIWSITYFIYKTSFMKSWQQWWMDQTGHIFVNEVSWNSTLFFSVFVNEIICMKKSYLVHRKLLYMASSTFMVKVDNWWFKGGLKFFPWHWISYQVYHFHIRYKQIYTVLHILQLRPAHQVNWPSPTLRPYNLMYQELHVEPSIN